MIDEAAPPVVLTHDMIAVRHPGATENAYWRCMNCGRAGTIRFINLVVCPVFRAVAPQSGGK